jgi:hypothetical protein
MNRGPLICALLAAAAATTVRGRVAEGAGRPAAGVAAPTAARCVCPTVRCLDDKPVVVPAGPYSLGLDAAVAIGHFRTHGTLAISLGWRLWQRIAIEGALHLGAGSDLQVLEGTLLAGVLLHVSRRIDLMLGWRVGYGVFRVAVPNGTLGVGAFVGSAIAELRWTLSPALELRAAPLVGTGYWNDLWGVVIEPSAGIAYRF